MTEPVRLELPDDGESLIASGPLTADPARIYFGTILGATEEAEGRWRVPLRGLSAEEMVERIARWAANLDLIAEAEEARAQRALEFIEERRASYTRTRQAATGYLALQGGAPVTEVDETELAERLRTFGWNEEARPLFEHQRRAALHALHAVHAANFSVPGAGKTTTTLAVIASHLAAGTIDVVVVIGPLSCFRPWEAEAEAALPGVLRVQRLHQMTPDQRARAFERAERGDLLLISYPSAAADEDALRLLGERLSLMLVVDESHRVKRFDGGQWAAAVVRIAGRARVRTILTGTPMPHSARDLWTQFTILWPGGELVGSRQTFRARVNTGVSGLVRHLEPYYFRTPKEGLGLDPYTVTRHPVEAPAVQSEIYSALADGLRAQVQAAGDHAARIQTLRRARPIRLLQAASNPALLAQNDGFFGVAPISAGTLLDRLDNYRLLGELPGKVEWVINRLAELQSNREKAVVWTSFLRNIDQVAELVRDRLVAEVYSVDGRVPASGGEEEDELNDTREQRIDRFLAADGFAVLVANPAACAESISLHANCHRAFYLDRTYDCARWLQSIDRIHRLGLPPGAQVEVHVPQLVIDGLPTIDELVNASLLRKEGAMQTFLRGAELRDGFLNEQDTLAAAEGDEQDLEELLRYLVGETSENGGTNGT